MIIDNQSNMRRELWQKGKLVAWVTANYLCQYKADRTWNHLFEGYDYMDILAKMPWGFYSEA